jgi:hypothetical protein
LLLKNSEAAASIANLISVSKFLPEFSTALDNNSSATSTFLIWGEKPPSSPTDVEYNSSDKIFFR